VYSGDVEEGTVVNEYARRKVKKKMEDITEEELIEAKVERCKNAERLSPDVCFVDKVAENIPIEDANEEDQELVTINPKDMSSIGKPIILKNESIHDTIMIAENSEKPLQKKKKVLFELSSETQEERQSDNPRKIFTDLERGLERSCLKFHPGRQEAVSIY